MGKILKIFFILTLIRSHYGHSQLEVTRGPYLQKLTQSSVIIRWQTNLPTDSRVRYGGSIFGLNQSETIVESTVDHSVEITDLDTNKKYFYSVGLSNGDLMSGENLYFITLPPKGTSNHYRFIALGDMGTGFQEQFEVSEAISNTEGTHFDGIILLGDNAYYSGTQTQYQNYVFDGKYSQFFENTVIWPSPGNHDYYGASIPMTPTAPYFDIFDCPTNAECGGVPSGVEQYYSFDYGNIHFISLDSYGVSRSDSSKMAHWLRLDLAQNTLPWTIAYWHHPPYTKGNHDSDNAGGGDYELVEMRENIVPILEEFGVDLVLNGHSHAYERSFLIDSHYGYSNTFSVNNIVQPGKGSFPDECPYFKYSYEPQHSGTVYTVVGVSGKTSFVQPDWPHPAMATSVSYIPGALILDVNDYVLNAKFLTKDEEIRDAFTMMKDVAFEEKFGYNCSPVESDHWITYPNPSGNIITLSNTDYLIDENDRVQIIDNNGNVVREFTPEPVNHLDTEDLAPGLYHFRVLTKEETVVLKWGKI